MLKKLAVAFACLSLPLLTLCAQNRAGGALPVGIRFAATEANSPPGTCGCFLLTGGAIDTAVPLGRSFSAAIEFAGNHAGNVPGTQRGLSTLSLLGGPRYDLALAHRHRIFVQALFGAARGFDADFQSGSLRRDTATVFSYHVDAAYEWAVTSAITLRAAQVGLVQTNLPNGTDNRQRNIQFGAGLVFRIPFSSLQR